MMVRWTPMAADDLASIHEYVAEDNESAAVTLVANIIQAISRLEVFPQTGRQGKLTGTRELAIAPYIVVYRIVKETVIIDAMLHGRRRYPL